eukprot:771821-Pyramimonas_sp.AAC.1
MQSTCWCNSFRRSRRGHPPRQYRLLIRREVIWAAYTSDLATIFGGKKTRAAGDHLEVLPAPCTPEASNSCS